MNSPSVRPRLWLIQLPDFNRNIALIEASTPTCACDLAARNLNMNVGSFRPVASESGHRMDKDGTGELLFAIDVTGILRPADADRLEAPDVIAKVDEIDDFDAYIAPRNHI